jgi:LacI family transcriptional regulator
MFSGQVTIRDLARELNVSCSTISRALKDHPGISKETKKAVIELANKWNYKPNAVALSLRKSKTNIIGVIIPELVHFFFSNVISGIEEVAYSKGYNIMICQSAESFDREINDADALISSRVDGLLVAISRETNDLGHFQEVIDNEMPIVFFDRLPHDQPVSSIVVDDKFGAYKATEHLIQQGCKHILHLCGPRHLLLGQKRIEGFKAALAHYGIPQEDCLIVDCPNGNRDHARQITREVLKEYPNIDGIFGHNDKVALGAMMAVKESGRKIPDDIAIIGFSDWEFSSFVEPQLSSISQPGLEMGREAAAMLIAQIENPNQRSLPPQTMILRTELLARGSSLRKRPE